MSAKIGVETLRQHVKYDPKTGVFTRIHQSSHNAGSGTVSRKLGYVSVSVCGKQYYGHRLAWFYTHGIWPTGQIDHMNGDRADNRIANLRDVSVQINRQNQRVPHARKKSGTLLGVCFVARRNKWFAQLYVNGTRPFIGYFDTEIEAHAAYVVAKRKYHAGNTL